jgi:hypothetical protein
MLDAVRWRASGAGTAMNLALPRRRKKSSRGALMHATRGLPEGCANETRFQDGVFK